MALLEVPHIQQKTNYSCGRACAVMILRHYGVRASEKSLETKLITDPNNGTEPWELVRFFRSRRHKIKQRYNMNMKELERLLDRGWPVIVAYQDWAHKPSETDYQTCWDNGHYAVVHGYDDEKLWFSDPSSKRENRSIPKKEFLGRWRDITARHRMYHRWGLAIGPKLSRRKSSAA